MFEYLEHRHGPTSYKRAAHLCDSLIIDKWIFYVLNGSGLDYEKYIVFIHIFEIHKLGCLLKKRGKSTKT